MMRAQVLQPIDRLISPNKGVPLVLSDDGTTVSLTYKMLNPSGGFKIKPDLTGTTGGFFFEANNSAGAAGNGFNFQILNDPTSGGLFRCVDNVGQTLFSVNGKAASSVASNRPIFLIQAPSSLAYYQDVIGAYQGGSAFTLGFSNLSVQAAGIRVLFNNGVTSNPALQAAGVAGIIARCDYTNTVAAASAKCAYGIAAQGGYGSTSVFGSSAGDWIAGGMVSIGPTANGNTIGWSGGFFVLRSATAPSNPFTNWIGLGICTAPSSVNAAGIMCSESIETVAEKPVIYNSTATFNNIIMPPATGSRPYTAYTKGNTSHRWVAAASVLRSAIGGTDTLDLSATALSPTTDGLLSLGTTALGFSALNLKDTAAAFRATLQFTNTGISANRVLTADLGDASRVLTLSGNPTLADWFDQSVKTAASPAFAGLTVNSFAFTVGGAPTLNDWFDQNVKTTGTPQHARIGVGTAADGTALIKLAAGNVLLDTTTGTKWGTAASEKQAWWNATPIVQPTTAIAAATFVANTSGIVDDSATFDGYTIGQVVKALRTEGLLA